MKQQISFLALNFSKQSHSAITDPWGFQPAEIKISNSFGFHSNEKLFEIKCFLTPDGLFTTYSTATYPSKIFPVLFTTIKF